MQGEYDCIYLVVDLHALTVQQVPAEFRKRCLSFVAQYIACGIDPEQNDCNSSIPAHAELSWLLGTMTHMGEQRMTHHTRARNRQH